MRSNQWSGSKTSGNWRLIFTAETKCVFMAMVVGIHGVEKWEDLRGFTGRSMWEQLTADLLKISLWGCFSVAISVMLW
jgi:hypothetical protein